MSGIVCPVNGMCERRPDTVFGRTPGAAVLQCADNMAYRSDPNTDMAGELEGHNGDLCHFGCFSGDQKDMGDSCIGFGHRDKYAPRSSQDADRTAET